MANQVFRSVIDLPLHSSGHLSGRRLWQKVHNQIGALAGAKGATRLLFNLSNNEPVEVKSVVWAEASYERVVATARSCGKQLYSGKHPHAVALTLSSISFPPKDIVPRRSTTLRLQNGPPLEDNGPIIAYELRSMRLTAVACSCGQPLSLLQWCLYDFAACEFTAPIEIEPIRHTRRFKALGF